MNFKSTFALIIAVLVSSTAIAGERGTRQEATDVVKAGFSLLEQKGADELVRVVNLRKSPYTDRDLYLFVIDPDGKIVAHGYDESRIGINAADLYDGDGQPYGSLFLKLADETGKWLSYKAYDPITGQVSAKTTLVRRRAGYILGCGVYE